VSHGPARPSLSDPQASRRRATTALAGMALSATVRDATAAAATTGPAAGGAFAPARPQAAGPAATDALYPPGFQLKGLAPDPILRLERPRAKANGLATPSYVDPAFGTRVYRATEAADFKDAVHVRHDYSRRQAFNADTTRMLATTSNGYWVLYDANTFVRLKRAGTDGALAGLAGDAEAIWHPSEPRALFWNQGLVWYQKDVESDRDTVMADFTRRLPWPGATRVWTKSEGGCSADGRYWAFMATSYDERTQRNAVYGLLSYDRHDDRILGMLDAAAFGGAFPDHVGITPSGRFAVPSWAHDKTRGTRAYPLDFSSSRQLHVMSEHSDLAFGPDGEDLYVFTDYERGAIRAMNVATGAAYDLLPLYPRAGSSYAAHVSGQAFGRPGWAVISTYADSASYGATVPDPKIEPTYRKVMLVELRPKGRRYAVAHTRTNKAYGGYFGEPQASPARDGSRIVFSSNFDDGGPPSSYVVIVPTTAYG
jgi:hypothetical protein